jgi:hypothetical protein
MSNLFFTKTHLKGGYCPMPPFFVPQKAIGGHPRFPPFLLAQNNTPSGGQAPRDFQTFTDHHID